MPMTACRNNRILAPTSQRGVIAISAAVMMLALFSFLALTVDTGRLFLIKRTMQKQSDLAALETALLYCRDQSMDAAQRLSVAQDVLSSERNNFQGELNNVQVELGQVTSTTDTEGRSFRQFTVDEDGKAIKVTLRRTVRASVFQQLMPSGSRSLTFVTSSVAEACQPAAQLTMRSNLATIDSSRSALLNTLLGGLLGTTLSLGVGDWQSLLDTNLNLLSYVDALATELNLDVGDYDSVLSTDLTIGELLDVAADVLQAGGNTAAINALDLISVAIPPGTPLVALGDLLEVQTGTEEAGLDTNLQLMQLVQGSIQFANKESGISAGIPIDLGIVTAYVQIQVTEPPQFSAIGNPEYAKNDPYGPDAIYVRSSQIKAFTSLSLPIVSALDPLLSSPLVSSITNVVNDLLSLNLLGVLSNLLCVDCQNEMIDIKALSSSGSPSASSSRIDVLVSAGNGQARVTGYDCDNTNDEKSLTSTAHSSAASIAIGQMTADNAFSSDPLSVDPVPILDIGKITVRRTCVLLICGYSYKKGNDWVSDPKDADRTPFAGGGIGLRFTPSDTSDQFSSPSSQPLTHENYPDETYLPELYEELTDDAFRTITSAGIVNDITNDILGNISIEFYEPEDNGIGGDGLGGVIYLLGSVVNPLLSGVINLLDDALAPLLDGILNNILGLLGASLAEAEVGAAMSCESDKVRLVM